MFVLASTTPRPTPSQRHEQHRLGGRAGDNGTREGRHRQPDLHSGLLDHRTAVCSAATPSAPASTDIPAATTTTHASARPNRSFCCGSSVRTTAKKNPRAQTRYLTRPPEMTRRGRSRLCHYRVLGLSRILPPAILPPAGGEEGDQGPGVGGSAASLP